MAHCGDSPRGSARGFLIGALVAGVVMLSLPVVAAVGGNLVLGRPNSADAVTSLSGKATTNLRLTNSQAGAPALDLRVASGAAPLKVNSTSRVAKLNADLLDGKHAAAFALAGHTHTGVYLSLLGQAADAALLDGLDSTDFSPAGHDHHGAYLGIGERAADTALVEGRQPSAFAGTGLACAPGALVGYDRSGPVCSAPVGAVTLDAGGDTGWNASLVLDASGFPVIAYYDKAAGDLRLMRCGDAACSRGNRVVTVDSTGNVGVGPALVLDGAGRPVIAYYDQTNGDLKLARCGDAACSGGNSISAVDAGGMVGRYASLAIDASGHPVIAYYDQTNGDLKLALCGDADCTSGNVLVVADTTGDVGQYTSLALDAAGFPWVSYHDTTGGTLKVLHCLDAVCGTWAKAGLDGGGPNYVGRWTSLALDPAGLPTISYYDDTNLDLKVAHCGSATCASGNSIVAVDTAGDVGAGSSVVFSASGLPVIAYLYGSAADLRVVRCGNVACTTGNTFVTVDTAGAVGYDPSLVLDGAGNPVIAYREGWATGTLKLAAAVG